MGSASLGRDESARRVWLMDDLVVPLFPSGGGIDAQSPVEVERIRSNLVAHIKPSASRNTHAAKHRSCNGGPSSLEV